ncbi:2-(hydroxymethyl)glutarate dehydrogenase [Labrenzia sp. THAF82]|nr:L-threonate dehydrogenase [Labrenzia sp. THAF82]QFT30431.1 2-(hydroxymethyl)glutarate dehydrogenase [Labrenzia sp. THAF82]
MTRPVKVAVVGLGSMGFGMARSCVRQGYQVFGSDIVTERMDSLRNEGGAAETVDAVAASLDAVVAVVLNADQTETILFGETGIVPKLKPGAVVVACATVPPDFARSMETRCQDHGVHYLDAPVSGGSVKAGEGKLSIMAAGTPEAFTAAQPVLEATAETVFKLGDTAGSGSAMKAVNQLLAGVHIAAMAEALTFGMTQGIDPQKFINVISRCAGTSWMLENRAPHVVAGDYTPHSQTVIWPKDLGIVLEAAKGSGLEAPITEAALRQYNKAVEMGLGHEDDAAITKVYARSAGLQLPGEG